jgi:quercetin dioxygenase-like cupin family protein
MKRHRTRVLAATAAVATASALIAVAGLIVVPALATPQSGLASTQVAMGRFGKINVRTHNFPPHKVKIKTKGDSDVYVIRNTFEPGGTTGWHTHPGPSLITVTNGEITAYEGDDPTCTPRTYRAGAGFVDPGDGHVHLLRNQTGEPAETVAVQILPKGAMRRIDAPDPGNCPFSASGH